MTYVISKVSKMVHAEAQTSYKHPEALVETSWVKEHLSDPKVRIAEVDYDPTANYNLGHVPGAVLFDWKKDMNDPVTRDILNKSQLEELLSKVGFSGDMTLVLYGDFNNWFAAFAFWILKYYQVDKVVLMNGGRKKWLAEDGAVTKDQRTCSRTAFKVKETNENIRTYLDNMKKRLGQVNTVLVDVRSPAEFTGEITAPPEYPNEHAQRGGHIPGAVNIPWSQAVREDGTFKTLEELRKLYEWKGVTADKDVVTYCRIGERSSFTWFVLKYLLGYPNVKNYDGSWTEWGNMIRNPIEKS
jgi:thiosulfate/3-mercaptopyruvate sulfurtransferase